MINKKTKDGRFTLRSNSKADMEQMVEVQIACFPTIARHEMLTKEHFANHIKIFPEGQFQIAASDQPIISIIIPVVLNNGAY